MTTALGLAYGAATIIAAPIGAGIVLLIDHYAGVARRR
jgi:hypothetical protein